MKVLFWAERFLPHVGGVEVFAGHLLPLLRKRYGHEFEVICCSATATGSDDSWRGFSVHRLPFHQVLLARDPSAVIRLRQRVDGLMQRFDPDLIHLNTSQPSLFFLARRTRSPVLFSAHEPVLAKAPNSMLGRTLAASDYVLTVSRYLHQELVRLCPAIEDRSAVVPCAVPIPTTGCNAPPDGPARFLCAGRVVADKGFDVAIRALHRVIRSGRSAHLSIAGTGPALPQLKELAVELDIALWITFLGEISPARMPEVLAESTAAIVPSRWPEPQGLLPLEAAQLGRPSIAARTGGLPEVVLDGETGLLFTVDAVEELAGRMSDCVDRPNLVSELGERALKRVRRDFSLDGCAEAHHRAYARAAGRTHS